jgi:hypothetical protein
VCASQAACIVRGGPTLERACRCVRKARGPPVLGVEPRSAPPESAPGGRWSSEAVFHSWDPKMVSSSPRTCIRGGPETRQLQDILDPTRPKTEGRVMLSCSSVHFSHSARVHECPAWNPESVRGRLGPIYSTDLNSLATREAWGAFSASSQAPA